MNNTQPAIVKADPVMRLEGLSKTYGRVMALSDVSLDIEPGIVHAIVGENGAGKSTLINLASGVVSATSGSIMMDGQVVTDVTPAKMRKLGIAVVHQHAALVPDLTVRENIALGLDSDLPSRVKVNAVLAEVADDGMGIDPDDRLSELTVTQWHVVEIAKAMLLDPRVMIFDEPTEPFGRGEVERLFTLIDGFRKKGVAIIYISHRLREVLSIAQTVTVLRDGKHIATQPRDDVNESDIVAQIAGRTMDQLLPDKNGVEGMKRLSVSALSGAAFSNVDLELHAGVIVGLAGIEGQGQRSFLRAIVGLEKYHTGEVRCDNQLVPPASRTAALEHGIGFVTDDRHAEGLFLGLPLQVNLSVPVLDTITRKGLLISAREEATAQAAIDRFSVKTDSVQATPDQLSGGNQQKVLFAREVGAKPRVLVVDEPTKGVDVGSRFEIYTSLRALSADGTAVLVLCSDALELQGLCDTVHVFSNGQIIETLDGEDVTETNIAAAMVGSSGVKADATFATRSTRSRRFFKGDLFPLIPVGLVLLAIMATASVVNPYYLTDFNLVSLGRLMAILAFVALGQACVFVVGGIDLSSGPLAGLAVVLASFLLPNSGGSLVLGVTLILLISLGIGLLHAAIILILKLPSVAVTLSTFVAIGGLSLLLRPKPSGTISFDYMDLMEMRILLVPVGLLMAIITTAILAYISCYTKLGRQMRAWGSDAAVAVRLGVSTNLMTIVAYGTSAVFAGIAGLLLAAQIGIGSASVGTEYTLMGISAFVISGASVAGGKLSFAAILVAAALVQVTLNVTSFLNLDSAWQYWLIGGTTVLGAAVFSQIRSR